MGLGRRKWGVVLMAAGVAISVAGQGLGNFFILAVALGCLLMVVGGALFARSFLED